MSRWFLLVACGLIALPLRADDPASAPKDPPDDGGVRDTMGKETVRPLPDVAEKLPTFLKQVDFLRQHHDGIQAIAYLRQVLSKADMLPQDHARAMLVLADCLQSEHQDAESLCWLKVWLQLYPNRPEVGAVAYREATLYRKMGLSDLARDAYYLSLAHTINQGHVQTADDLKFYTRLTVATLWALSLNEYEGGQWDRAAQLFARYRTQSTASPVSLEKAAFYQADCYYQLHQQDKATALYEEMLRLHPFNPLAPQARMRLYHLDMLAHSPGKAQQELQALAWTVRTVWPKDEVYWQEKAAQLLLALNKKDIAVLPPLLQRSQMLHEQDKAWQDSLNHYDALVRYEAGTTMKEPAELSQQGQHRLAEDDELTAMSHSIDQLPPAPSTTPTAR